MENASKALLMAAGILIGVLLLSLAAFLYGSFGGASETVQANIEQGQINQFNNFFAQYTTKEEKDEFTNKSFPACTIYDIITVVNYAQNYNSSNEGLDESKAIKVVGRIGGSEIDYTQMAKNANFNESTLKTVIENSQYAKTENLQFKLLKFSCTLEHNDYDGRVNKVIFTYYK